MKRRVIALAGSALLGFVAAPPPLGADSPYNRTVTYQTIPDTCPLVGQEEPWDALCFKTGPEQPPGCGRWGSFNGDTLWQCPCGGPFPVNQTIQLQPPFEGFVPHLWAAIPRNSNYWTAYNESVLPYKYGRWLGTVRLPDGTPVPGTTVNIWAHVPYTQPQCYGGPQVVQEKNQTTNALGQFNMSLLSQSNSHHTECWFAAPDSFYRLYRQDYSGYAGAHVPARSAAGYLMDSPFGSNNRVEIHPCSWINKDIRISELERGYNPKRKPSNPDLEDPNPERDEDNKGEACEAPHTVGKPVDVVSGNVFVQQKDAVVGGLRGAVTFLRTYNSDRAFNGIGGAFGRGWDLNYEKSISMYSSEILRLSRGSGFTVYYTDRDGDGTFEPALPSTERSTVVVVPDGGWERRFSNGGREVYDEAGLLVRQIDRVGNITLLGRTNGRLDYIAAPGGRTLHLQYTGDTVTTLAGPQGVIANYSYEDGLLSTVSYPDGSAYSFTYGPAGLLLTVRDATNLVLEAHTYDPYDGRGLTSEEAGGTNKYTLEYSANFTRVTDGGGRVMVFRHDGENVEALDGACGLCGGGAIGQWSYDKGRVVSTTGAFGAKTTYNRDPATGRVTSVIDPAARTTSYLRDEMGRAYSITDNLNHTTSLVHGPAGPTSITSPAGTTNLHWGAQGQLDWIQDPRGKTTNFTYFGNGDLETVTDPVGRSLALGYDPAGRLQTVTNDEDKTWRVEYDARGRVKWSQRPDGKKTTFTYDLGGRMTKVEGPDGKTADLAYDSVGRLSVVKDPAHGTTRYSYDAMSRVVELEDARGQKTLFERDTEGRVTKTIYPGGGTESISYDAAGYVQTATDKRGVTVTYTRAIDGLALSRSFSDGTPAETFGYDGLGRLASISNGDDTLTFGYDNAGRLISEASAANGSTVSYTYDANGNRIKLTLDDVDFLGYSYNDASQLEALTRGAAQFGLGYNTLGRRSSLTYPNGVVTSYEYDDLGRLLLLSTAKNQTLLSSFTYGHDQLGNRTAKTALDHAESYTYDALSRLTGVGRTGAGAQAWNFAYDAVGNRTNEQMGASVVTYAYDQRNRLTAKSSGGTLRWRGSLSEPGSVSWSSGTVNGVPARLLPGGEFEADIPAQPGTNTVTLVARDARGNERTTTYQVDVEGSAATYSYDAAGNLTERSEPGHTWTYEWSAVGQLKTVRRDGAEVASFAYDPLGRRIRKTASGVITRYLYDGMDILRTAATEGANTTVTKFIHGPGIDEPLAEESGGVVRYLHADGLGSVVASTDAAGALLSSVRYDAWGNIEAGAPTTYAYTGREWDPEIGLYYYRARYYDPAVGRFISEDPIGFRGGINFYGYVSGNPASTTDPLGLIGQSDANSFHREYRRAHPEGPGPDSSGLGTVLTSANLALVGGAVAVMAVDLLPAIWIEAQIAAATGRLDAFAELLEGAVGGPPRCRVRDLNPTHDMTKSKKAFQRLVEDIRANGIQDPIKYVVHDGQKYIVDGHHRYYAALRLGLSEVPAQEVTLPYDTPQRTTCSPGGGADGERLTMSLWHYDFFVVPRVSLQEALGLVPQFVDRETFESVQWWRGRGQEALQDLATLLPPLPWWDSATRCWGAEDGDRIEVLFDSGEAAECFVRVDLRSLGTGVLSRLLIVASDRDLVIVTPALRVLEPTPEALWEALRSSPAREFVDDPEAFLSNCKRAGAITRRAPTADK